MNAMKMLIDRDNEHNRISDREEWQKENTRLDWRIEHIGGCNHINCFAEIEPLY
jgi:hypothetical protein